jgi:hypothetical protein
VKYQIKVGAARTATAAPKRESSQGRSRARFGIFSMFAPSKVWGHSDLPEPPWARPLKAGLAVCSQGSPVPCHQPSQASRCAQVGTVE